MLRPLRLLALCTVLVYVPAHAYPPELCHSLDSYWVPISKISATARAALNQNGFGAKSTGQALNPCRGVINGETAVGKYSAEYNVCFVPYYGREYTLTEAEVFMEYASNPECRFKYSLYQHDSNGTIFYLPAGQMTSGMVGYIAIARVYRNGMYEDSIGKVWQGDLTRAYFPFDSVEIIVDREFTIVGCANYCGPKSAEYVPI